MNFKTYFLSMTTAQREVFAEKARSSKGYLTHLAYRRKFMSLGLADVLIRLSKSRLKHSDLPLSDKAKAQLASRGAPKRSAARSTARA
jgi:hypothetical protein